jgi:hypothetical protein
MGCDAVKFGPRARLHGANYLDGDIALGSTQPLTEMSTRNLPWAASQEGLTSMSE